MSKLIKRSESKAKEEEEPCSVLADFMELGADRVGSYTLGRELNDIREAEILRLLRLLLRDMEKGDEHE